MVDPSNHTGQEKQGHSPRVRNSKSGLFQGDPNRGIEPRVNKTACHRCGNYLEDLKSELTGEHCIREGFDLTLHKLRFCSECRAWARREGVLPANLTK